MGIEQWTGPAELKEEHGETPYMRQSFAKRERDGWTTQITLWKKVSP